jgi:hypothetical protein
MLGSLLIEPIAKKTKTTPPIADQKTAGETYLKGSDAENCGATEVFVCCAED